MDGADGIGVVVEKGQGALDEGSADREFLLQFAHQGALVGRRIKGLPQPVAVVDVTADADGTFLEQPRLAGSASPAVVEDLVSGGDHHVGNELLEGGIILSLGARSEEMIAGLEKDRQVAADLRVEAVKGAQLVKE